MTENFSRPVEQDEGLVAVTQADRDLYSRLLGLANANRERREHGRPIISGLELIARHRIEALATHPSPTAAPFRMTEDEAAAQPMPDSLALEDHADCLTNSELAAPLADEARGKRLYEMCAARAAQPFPAWEDAPAITREQWTQIASDAATLATPHAGASSVTGVQTPAEMLPLDLAPRDGSMLRLFVDYTDGGAPLEDAQQAWTIGFNNLDNTGEDEWQFAGWSWEQDVFCQGSGKVLGWLPTEIAASPPSPIASEQMEALRNGYAELLQWCAAYPVRAFPEPDLARAAEVLKAAGMTLDAISASNFRHVLRRVEEISRAALSIDAPALPATPSVRGVDEKRCSWGYPDGVPGTPEYEPVPRICNRCQTVASLCQCDGTPAQDQARPDHIADAGKMVRQTTDTANNDAVREALAIARDAAREAERVGKLHPENSASRDRMFARAREASAIAEKIAALTDAPADEMRGGE